VRRGYKGITIPTPEDIKFQGGFLEMDPPEQRQYRQLLNPYLSPAAVSRWAPVVEELVRPSLNEKIETGGTTPLQLPRKERGWTRFCTRSATGWRSSR
jgi:cytochrome P450